MTDATGAAAAFRFTTDAFPEHQRLEAWQETFGRKVVGIDTAPLSDMPFRVDLTVRALPGLTVIHQDHTPVLMARTRGLIADGDDGVALGIPLGGSLARQNGREEAIDAGDAVFLSNADAGTNSFTTPSTLIGLVAPRAALAPRLHCGGDVVMRRISRDTEALRLLKLYLRTLGGDETTLSTPDVQRAVIDHVYDLMALALGATRDAMESARARGLAAGRLAAIRADVRDNLADTDLDIAAVARRTGLSPRQVQRLFRAQGQTFSDYLRAQRLERAQHMLTRARYAHLSVSAVAYEAGFGDLSHFNHAFRRRFGATPTEVRMEAHFNCAPSPSSDGAAPLRALEAASPALAIASHPFACARGGLP